MRKYLALFSVVFICASCTNEKIADTGRVRRELTVSDYVEILLKIEERQGYEAARYYVTNNLDYMKITGLARGFADGKDNNEKNDPNIMPTRFMLLYGADDDKLRCVDSHPDGFEDASGPDHKITVANLRKGLRLLGYDVEESGPFDHWLLSAFLKYLKRFTSVNWYIVSAEMEGSQNVSVHALMDECGLASWRYFDRTKCYNDGKVDYDCMKKELSPEYGDELVDAAVGNIAFGRTKTSYHYPWVAFSMEVNLNNPRDICGSCGTKEYQDKEEVEYKIFAKRSGALIAKGTVRRPFHIKTLAPDSESIDISVDGKQIVAKRQ
jgi:hypothetical protein